METAKESDECRPGLAIKIGGERQHPEEDSDRGTDQDKCSMPGRQISQQTVCLQADIPKPPVVFLVTKLDRQALGQYAFDNMCLFDTCQPLVQAAELD